MGSIIILAAISYYSLDTTRTFKFMPPDFLNINPDFETLKVTNNITIKINKDGGFIGNIVIGCKLFAVAIIALIERNSEKKYEY